MTGRWKEGGKAGMLGFLAIGKGSKAAAEIHEQYRIFTGKKSVFALVR